LATFRAAVALSPLIFLPVLVASSLRADAAVEVSAMADFGGGLDPR
jgi:hypothetical protein